MRRGTRRLTATAVIAIGGLVLAACDDHGTKASGATTPVTLSIGTDEFPGNPLSEQIVHFVDEVTRLSDGKILVEPSWHAAGDGPDWDQNIAHMVRDGDLDLALVPTRGWDVEGVTSMRALNAPFGIESEELLDAVVQDDDLAADLMGGLPDYGVTGLALLPQGLRHPFSFGDPFLAPADYAGKVIRAAHSDTIAAVFSALGATTTDEGEPDPSLEDGLESAFELAPGGTATGNVTLYPKANVLVVGDDARGHLDDGQLDVLQRAAEATRDWAVQSRATDADLAAAYCDGGGVVVLAPAEDVAAMRQATAGVTEQLATDPLAESELAAIDELRGTVTPGPAVQACGGSAPAPDAAGASAPSPLDGVYRFEASEQVLRDAGAGPDEARENSGSFTFTFDSGKYCWTQQAEGVTTPTTGCGTYEVDGDRMTWTWPGLADETLAFTLRDDGALVFTPSGPVSTVTAAWASVPWSRTGPVG